MMFGFQFGKKKQEEAPIRTIEKVVTITTDFRIREQLNAPIKNTIAVASGKGGVGKSTVSTNIALALAQDGAKVGLLDADIYGPNIPMMVGVNQPPLATGNRIIPNEAYGMKIMSM